MIILSKIEKEPRGIRGETPSKDMSSSRNLVSTIGAQASPIMGDGISKKKNLVSVTAGGLKSPQGIMLLWY